MIYSGTTYMYIIGSGDVAGAVCDRVGGCGH